MVVVVGEAEDVAASQPRVIMVGGAKSGGEAAPPGTAELSQAAVEAPSDGEAASASVVGGWNIHTFVNFDEFLMNLSPKLISDRRIVYLIYQKLELVLTNFNI